MADAFIQVRLSRGTRECIRTVGAALLARGLLTPANRASPELSPEQVITHLLGQWEGHRARSKKSRNSA